MSEPAHLKSPFAFNSKGKAATVTQETQPDRLGRAYNVAVCVEGEREDNPSFGIPDPTFETIPLDTGAVQRAIEKWAEVSLTVSETEEALSTAARRLTVEVS